jgi:hypothetical protein
VDPGECRHNEACWKQDPDGLWRYACEPGGCGLSGAPAATPERARAFFRATSERVKVVHLMGLRRARERPLTPSEEAQIAYSSYGDAPGCNCPR